MQTLKEISDRMNALMTKLGGGTSTSDERELRAIAADLAGVANMPEPAPAAAPLDAGAFVPDPAPMPVGEKSTDDGAATPAARPSRSSRKTLG